MADHTSLPSEKCCDQWMKAQQSGTDNEMYGRLLRDFNAATGGAREWHIGCDLAPVQYCPWCGAEKA